MRKSTSGFRLIQPPFTFRQTFLMPPHQVMIGEEANDRKRQTHQTAGTENKKYPRCPATEDPDDEENEKSDEMDNHPCSLQLDVSTNRRDDSSQVLSLKIERVIWISRHQRIQNVEENSSSL